MLLLASIGIGLGSLILSIIGIAIPYWLYFGDHEDIHYGLWKICENKVCISVNDFNKNFTENFSSYGYNVDATRAMEILGMLITLSAVVCAVLKQFVVKTQVLLPKLGGYVALLGGWLMIGGTIVYARMKFVVAYQAEGLPLHVGFALCIVSGILSELAGALMIYYGHTQAS